MGIFLAKYIIILIEFILFYETNTIQNIFNNFMYKTFKNSNVQNRLFLTYFALCSEPIRNRGNSDISRAQAPSAAEGVFVESNKAKATPQLLHRYLKDLHAELLSFWAAPP